MLSDNEQEESNFKYLYQIPNKNGRLVSLAIQTTGLSKDNNIIEIGACEVINGNMTNDRFQIKIQPRYYMTPEVINTLTSPGEDSKNLSIHILS